MGSGENNLQPELLVDSVAKDQTIGKDQLYAIAYRVHSRSGTLFPSTMLPVPRQHMHDAQVWGESSGTLLRALTDGAPCCRSAKYIYFHGAE